GSRRHENREERFRRLAQVVKETMERGGNLLIPAFAVGRTQDMLYALRVLQDQGAIPPLKIYIDSPLAVAATKVFQKHAQVFDYKTRSMLGEGRSPFESPDVHYTESVQESIRLNSVSGGLVIISASGMADAGRIKHHLRHNLWRPEAGVLFIGHQAQGTLGRRLQDGAQEVRIHGEPVRVKASVYTITGFSAHGDQKALLRWLKRFRYLEQVFVTHGDYESCHFFANEIRQKLDLPAIVPKLDEIFDLSDSKIISVWEDRFRQLYVEENFSGAVQVLKDRRILFRGCYGRAQRTYEIKNEMSTKFNLGSGRALIAKAGLYNLAAQGKISPDDLHILKTWQEMEEKISALTQGPSRDFLQREILSKAKMEQSGYYYLDRLPAQAAVGYTRNAAGEEVENIYALLQNGAAPQFFSTVHDLNRFWEALFSGKLMGLDAVEDFLRDYRGDHLPSDFYQVLGQAPGARMILGGSPSRSVQISVLSNGEEGVRSVYNQLVDLSLSD
ncbi:MAG: hypothetical protein GX335_04395, partial [Firmicutes bacterium]|nr:hypothetical protein [Bacillota bacterium]